MPGAYGVRQLLTPVCRVVFGADPGELSLLAFLHYASSSETFQALVDVQGGNQQDRIVGGAQQIVELLADRLGREHLLLNAPVDRIGQGDDGVCVECGASKVSARYLICTVPLALVDRIHFDPALPTMRDQLNQRVSMGATVKVLVVYPHPFWRDAGDSGEVVCTTGPASVVYDSTTVDGVAALVCFVTGAPARGWSERDETQRREALLTQLAQYFGEQALSPRAYHEQDWAAERWTGGCPITNFPPGTLSVFGEALREPVGRLFWAGTESACEGTGFMEGAVESGARVAREVLLALGKEAV